MGSEPLIDCSSLIYAEQIGGDDEQDTALLQQMHADAKGWISGFPWCKEIQQSFLGCGVGGICAVFLFEIAPASADIDRWLWVIVGDIPPAYLVIDQAETPSAALALYLDLMQTWVQTVEQSEPVDDLIPVNIAPTHENAASVQRRLECLRELDIPRFRAKGPAHT